MREPDGERERDREEQHLHLEFEARQRALGLADDQHGSGQRHDDDAGVDPRHEAACSVGHRARFAVAENAEFDHHDGGEDERDADDVDRLHQRDQPQGFLNHHARRRTCEPLCESGHAASRRFLIIVDEGPGSPKGTGALFRATAVTPVNAEVQTRPTMKVPPLRPLMQIKDRHERRAKPDMPGDRHCDDRSAVHDFRGHPRNF